MNDSERRNENPYEVQPIEPLDALGLRDPIDLGRVSEVTRGTFGFNFEGFWQKP